MKHYSVALLEKEFYIRRMLERQRHTYCTQLIIELVLHKSIIKVMVNFFFIQKIMEEL